MSNCLSTPLSPFSESRPPQIPPTHQPSPPAQRASRRRRVKSSRSRRSPHRAAAPPRGTTRRILPVHHDPPRLARVQAAAVVAMEMLGRLFISFFVALPGLSSSFRQCRETFFRRYNNTRKAFLTRLTAHQQFWLKKEIR